VRPPLLPALAAAAATPDLPGFFLIVALGRGSALT